jgi:hypothetical protein
MEPDPLQVQAREQVELSIVLARLRTLRPLLTPTQYAQFVNEARSMIYAYVSRGNPVPDGAEQTVLRKLFPHQMFRPTSKKVTITMHQEPADQPARARPIVFEENV